MRLLALVLVLMLGGCTRFKFTDPKTGQVCTLERFGYDTKAGRITAYGPSATQPARLEIENLDSTARAIESLNKSLDLLRAAVEAK